MEIKYNNWISVVTVRRCEDRFSSLETCVDVSFQRPSDSRTGMDNCFSGRNFLKLQMW